MAYSPHSESKIIYQYYEVILNLELLTRLININIWAYQFFGK